MEEVDLGVCRNGEVCARLMSPLINATNTLRPEFDGPFSARGEAECC